MADNTETNKSKVLVFGTMFCSLYSYLHINFRIKLSLSPKWDIDRDYLVL